MLIRDFFTSSGTNIPLPLAAPQATLPNVPARFLIC